MGQPNCIRTAHARAYAKENRSNEGNDKNEGGVGGI